MQRSSSRLVRIVAARTETATALSRFELRTYDTFLVSKAQKTRKSIRRSIAQRVAMANEIWGCRSLRN